MFTEKLKKGQIIAIFDKIGLFGENADKAYLKYGKLDELVDVCFEEDGEFWVDVKQFNKNGEIYTKYNTTNNDKIYANSYLFSDFEIQPAQPNLTKKDYEIIQRRYCKEMFEIFGEEYLSARNEYNFKKQSTQALEECSVKVRGRKFSNRAGVTILRNHRSQIEKAIKLKNLMEIEEEQLILEKTKNL